MQNHIDAAQNGQRRKEATIDAVERLPCGTLTFVMTDIEGSTRLWEQYPEPMREVMATHDAVIEAAVARFSGELVRPRGEGDSRFAVFRRASDAVAAAAAIQRTLADHPWPIASLRVRVALHTGEAGLVDGDYYGSTVNRCARLRNAAHGGQTIISSVTRALAQDDLPDGVALRDLGMHTLRDLREPEHIYQLVVPGLPSHFPPLKTSGGTFSNLPTALTSFVGRSDELAQVKSLLKAVRSITITGTGGVGKSRLALQAAADLEEVFPDGVWLIELAPLSDPTLVPQAVANVLGIREERERYPLERMLVEYLHNKNIFLIFDNCEHLIQRIAELTAVLLRETTDVRLLATSREPLGTPGEVVYSILPLNLPALDTANDLDKFVGYDVIKLFIDRAVAARPDFAVTAQNAPAIAQICVQLDGIPLAVELAAARVRVFSVEDIAARLDQRLRLLVGSRTAAPRQQTLKNLIDWSYDLLSDDERVLFQRLSVFRGGWTLAAAEEVCSDNGVDAREIPALLAHLVDKSLVGGPSRVNRQRYQFLVTLRHYAEDRLAETNEIAELKRRHAGYFLRLAEGAGGNLSGPTQAYWLKTLDADLDNLRAALAWLGSDDGDAEMQLRMTGSLWRFWEIRGYITEGRAYLQNALARNGDAPAEIRGRALHGAGTLARLQGDYEQAQQLHTLGLSLFQDIGDMLGISREFDVLGEIAWLQGDHERASELHHASLALRAEVGHPEDSDVALSRLGVMEYEYGNYEQARELLRQSLELSNARDDRLSMATYLTHLGMVAYALCEYDKATGLFDEALMLYRELNDRMGVSNTLGCLGNVGKDQGYFDQAILCYTECLELREELGDRYGIAQVKTCLAEVAFFQGDYSRAEELVERSLSLFHQLGVKRGVMTAEAVRAFIAHYQGHFDEALAAAEQALALATELKSPQTVAYAREICGLVEYAAANLPAAMKLLQEALSIFRSIGDKRNVVHCLINLARVAYRQGDVETAVRFLDEGTLLSHNLDIRWSRALLLEISGLIERSRGNYDHSAALFQQSLNLSAEQGNLQGIANCLGALGGLAAVADQSRRAAVLFAAAGRMRTSVGMEMGSGDRREYEQYLVLLREQLDPADFEAAWDEGWKMSLEAAVDEAHMVTLD